MLISVVLPAPLGPSSAKISPRRISRLMSLRARNPDAYVLERFEIEMTGCMRVSSTKNAHCASSAKSQQVREWHVSKSHRACHACVTRSPEQKPDQINASCIPFVSELASARAGTVRHAPSQLKQGVCGQTSIRASDRSLRRREALAGIAPQEFDHRVGRHHV